MENNKQSSTSKCLRCGRPLKAPESIALGYGHTCAEKEGLVVKKVKTVKKVKKTDSMNLFDFVQT